ncbi:MAG: N-6 DNA methylase [Treponema sp.]|nr:N-6 DNA methylase [Treponema sp.]
MSYAKHYFVERALRKFNFVKGENTSDFPLLLSFLAFVCKKEKIQLNLTVSEILEQNLRPFIKAGFDKYGQSLKSENLAFFEKVSEEDLQSYIKEDIEKKNTKLFKKNEVSSETLSTELNHLCAGLLEIGEEDSVLDLGSGLSSFLIDAAKEYDAASYDGIEISEKVNFYGKILSYLEGFNFNVMEEDIFSLENSKKYDRIFSCPPRDLISDEKALAYTKEKLGSLSENPGYESAFILKTLDMLQDNGRAVILTFQNILNAQNFQDIRKYLIEKKCLEAVISLPNGLLTFSNMSTAILILKKGSQEAKIVDATNLYSVSRRGGNWYTSEDIEAIIKLVWKAGKTSKPVALEQIRKNDYNFSPSNYLFKAKIPVDFECRYTELSNLVSKKISRGIQYKADDLKKNFTSEDSNFYYVSAKDIQEGQMSPDLQKLNEITEKDQASALQEDDIVLVMALTDTLKVSHVHNIGEKKILPASNLYVIRLDKSRMLPLFLKLLLETPRANKIFNYFGVGSAIRSISAEFLNKLLVPIPTLDIQQSYVEKYATLEREEAELKERIKKIEEEKKGMI